MSSIPRGPRDVTGAHWSVSSPTFKARLVLLATAVHAESIRSSMPINRVRGSSRLISIALIRSLS